MIDFAGAFFSKTDYYLFNISLLYLLFEFKILYLEQTKIMKKNLLILLIILLSSSTSNLLSQIQTPTLYFDGLDDYVNLGADAAMNARTIEFWFQLSNDVDASLQKEIFLFGTEVPYSNVDEWHLTLTRSGTPHPAGTLRFVYVDEVGVVSQVYSDSDSWDANRWYHVAVVIDPSQGMMMFVDGVKQNIVEPSFTAALMPNGYNLEIGRQRTFDRYFEGYIDDLRTSTDALYLSDFTPPCPSLAIQASTIGLWNFNENSGFVATDSSNNNYDGQINGCSWYVKSICDRLNVDAQYDTSNLAYYPNPTEDRLNFDGLMLEDDVTIVFYDTHGRSVLRGKITSINHSIDLSGLKPGVYFFRISSKNDRDLTGKVIKE